MLKEVRFAFIKKEGSYAERTAKLLAAEQLEQKLRSALSSQ